MSLNRTPLDLFCKKWYTCYRRLINLNQKIKNHCLAFFTIFIWGITFISTKHLEKSFSALEILFVRYIIAYIVCWIICPRPLKFTGLKSEAMLLAAAVSGSALYQYLENLSVSYTNPASVSFITAATPIFMAVLAHRFLGEKVTVRNIIGMFISIIGIFFICFGDSKSLETGLLGDLIIFGIIWLWAVYSILVKKISALGFEQFQVTRRLFMYSVILMIPFMAFKPSHMDFSALSDPYFLMNFAFLGIFASALCFSTWNISVATLGATTTSKYLFIMPLITLIAQSIYDKSGIGIAALIGMFITLGGIGFSEFGKKP